MAARTVPIMSALHILVLPIQVKHLSKSLADQLLCNLCGLLLFKKKEAAYASKRIISLVIIPCNVAKPPSASSLSRVSLPYLTGVGALGAHCSSVGQTVGLQRGLRQVLSSLGSKQCPEDPTGSSSGIDVAPTSRPSR